MRDDVKQSWQALAEQMSGLGSLMQDRFAAPAADAEATSTEGTAEPLREALDEVVAATRELGERIGDLARDDDVRASARDTMASLDDALRTTVDVIAERIEGAFKPTESGEQGPA